MQYLLNMDYLPVSIFYVKKVPNLNKNKNLLTQVNNIIIIGNSNLFIKSVPTVTDNIKLILKPINHEWYLLVRGELILLIIMWQKGAQLWHMPSDNSDNSPPQYTVGSYKNWITYCSTVYLYILLFLLVFLADRHFTFNQKVNIKVHNNNI